MLFDHRPGLHVDRRLHVHVGFDRPLRIRCHIPGRTGTRAADVVDRDLEIGVAFDGVLQAGIDDTVIGNPDPVVAGTARVGNHFLGSGY